MGTLPLGTLGTTMIKTNLYPLKKVTLINDFKKELHGPAWG
jgi:hypothetical protein